MKEKKTESIEKSNCSTKKEFTIEEVFVYVSMRNEDKHLQKTKRTFSEIFV